MDKEIYFKARYSTVSKLYIHGIIFLLLYIGYAFFAFKLVEPYTETIGNLLHAKGALLMIMIALPFLVVFFSLSYFFYKFLIFREQQINCSITHHKICVISGEKKLPLIKTI